MTTAERLGQLKDLASQGGQNMLKRIDLAAKILEDSDWLESVHKGDLTAARDFLEETYFGDLCGAIALSALLLCRKHVPDDSAWKKAKYNVQKIYASVLEMEAKANPKKQNKQIEAVSVKTFRELSEKCEVLDEQYKKASVRAEQMERNFSDAQRKVYDLEEELKDAKMRIKELMEENAELRKQLKGKGKFVNV